MGSEERRPAAVTVGPGRWGSGGAPRGRDEGPYGSSFFAMALAAGAVARSTIDDRRSITPGVRKCGLLAPSRERSRFRGSLTIGRRHGWLVERGGSRRVRDGLGGVEVSAFRSEVPGFGRAS